MSHRLRAVPLLAVDATVVSPLHADGSGRRNAATSSGVVLQAARRAKETTYPELSGEGGRAHLVVLAATVGGQGRPVPGTEGDIPSARFG